MTGSFEGAWAAVFWGVEAVGGFATEAKFLLKTAERKRPAVEAGEMRENISDRIA